MAGSAVALDASSLACRTAAINAATSEDEIITGDALGKGDSLLLEMNRLLDLYLPS